MKDALIGMGTAVLLLTVGALAYLGTTYVQSIPPAQSEPTLPVTVDGLFGAAWLIGMATLFAAALVRDGLMEIARAIRERREAP